MGTIISGIIFGLLLLAIAIFCRFMVHRIESNRWPSNVLLGFRTPATSKSTAAWNAGHLAALPFLKVGSWAALAGGLLLATAGFLTAGAAGGALIMVMVGVFCWVLPLGILFLGGFKADQVASSTRG